MSAMPEWVPVFRAQDMTRGVIEDGERRCAEGWLLHLGIPWRRFHKAYRAANGPGCVCVESHNDHTCRTNQERADAMNRAMRWLGYTEVEDWHE